MDHCRMCHDKGQNEVTLKPVNAFLRKAIETLFCSKVNISLDTINLVCHECDKTLLDFYHYYLKVLDNYAEQGNLIGPLSVDIKEEECLTIESLDYTALDNTDDDNESDIKQDTMMTKEEENQMIKEFFGLACDECSLDFKRWDQLRAHAAEVHAVKDFSLQCCSRKFAKRCNIVDHVLSHLHPDKLKCTECNKMFTNRESLRIHSKVHQVERYICYNCHKGFLTKGEIRTHMQIHLSRESDNKYACLACGKCYTWSSKLRRHLQLSKQCQPCVCEICKETFDSRMDYLTHYEDAHGKPPEHQCKECKKCFTKLGSLQKHNNRHHKTQKPACTVCGLNFKSKFALDEHSCYNHRKDVKVEDLLKFESNCTEVDQECEIKYIPEGDSNPMDCDDFQETSIITVEEENEMVRMVFMLNCMKCENVTFDRWEDLRGHMKDVHSRDKFSIQCCSRDFSKRCRIVDHAMSHLCPEKLKCNLCDKHCASRDTLRAHWKTHAGDKYLCDVCKRCFNTKGSLQTHIYIHMSAESKEDLTSKKNFFCPHCPKKGFIWKSHLDKHIARAHLERITYFCDVCAKQFKAKTSFLTHRKNAHGVKEELKVQCPECQKWMLNQECLRKHLVRIHGPGPYICELCGKEVQTKHALTVHTRYHHPVGELFKCETENCSKVFKTIWQLKDHTNWHLGVSSTCKYCNKSFKTRCGMYKHRKKAHPVEYQRDKIGF